MCIYCFLIYIIVASCLLMVEVCVGMYCSFQYSLGFYLYSLKLSVAIWQRYGNKSRLHTITNAFLFSCRNRSLNLNEILNLLSEVDEPGDIYTEPPEVQELTDEDSGNEDEENTLDQKI